MVEAESIAHPHRWRRVSGLVEWTVLGFLLGGMGPFLMLVLLGAQLSLVAFSAAAIGVGVLGGIVLGVIDPPRRYIATGPPAHRALSALVHALVGGLVGALWAGLAGGAGGVAMVLAGSGQFPISASASASASGEDLLVFGCIGAAMGSLTGAPGVSLFSGVRAALLGEDAPTFSAVPAAAGLTLALGPFGYLAGAMFGMVVLASFFNW